MIFLLLIPLLAYPVLSYLVFLLKKPFDLLLIKVLKNPVLAKKITAGAVIFSTFPVHTHANGYMSFDITLPHYFVLKEWIDGVGPGSEINYFFPAGLTRSGLDFWIFGISGVLFQVLWLVFSIKLIGAISGSERPSDREKTQK